MLSLIGFGIIVTFMVLIFTKKVSVITALVLVPLFFGLLAGFAPKELGKFALEGIKTVAPMGVLLMFAVLYFAIMLDAGLFDPVVALIIKTVKGDPLKVIMGTAILTFIVHLDGDGTATFMIVISAFLPIYKLLHIDRAKLATIVALAVGPMHLVPWSGTSARAISVLKTDADQIFNPNIPAILVGIVWVLIVAFFLGKGERKRLGIVPLDHHPHKELSPDQIALRRPKTLIFNAILTVCLILALMKSWLPTPILFVIGAIIALVLNYPKPADQQLVLKRHGQNIFMVSSMIFAAGVFSGILKESKMIDEIAASLVSIIPASKSSFLPVFTAITSLPASLLFTPDSYYFGVVPVLSTAAAQVGIDPLEIGRAALLGQMTVGFPISPLTASTFLLIGLCEIDLADHQKSTFSWAWGTTIIMTLTAILTGSISI